MVYYNILRRFKTFCDYLQHFETIYNILRQFTTFSWLHLQTIYNILRRFTVFWNIFFTFWGNMKLNLKGNPVVNQSSLLIIYIRYVYLIVLHIYVAAISTKGDLHLTFSISILLDIEPGTSWCTTNLYSTYLIL